MFEAKMVMDMDIKWTWSKTRTWTQTQTGTPSQNVIWELEDFDVGNIYW
jgi:hypothetical protein